LAISELGSSLIASQEFVEHGRDGIVGIVVVRLCFEHQLLALENVESDRPCRILLAEVVVHLVDQQRNFVVVLANELSRNSYALWERERLRDFERISDRPLIYGMCLHNIDGQKVDFSSKLLQYLVHIFHIGAER